MSEGDAGSPPIYWRMIEPWWKRISIYDGPDRFLREFNAAPEPVRHLFATHWLQSEVRNGGFAQFFDNPTGVLAPEAECGFRAIGMPQTADIVLSQMKAFGSIYPRKRGARESHLSALEKLVNRLLKAEDFAALTRLGQDMGPGDEEIWALLQAENGGFVVAADNYALENDPDLA